MRTRARAAVLCTAAVLLALAAPAAAPAQVPPPVIDNTVWPSNSGNVPSPNNPHLVSPGPCDPGDGSLTFTFAQTGQGRLGHADGTFAEQGSFTIARVDGVLRVTAFDSTFSGESPNAAVSGERHLRPSEVARTSVRCTGTSDADRNLEIIVPRAHTDATVTWSYGAVEAEHGWAYVIVGTYSKPSRAGWYFSQFSSDQDRDQVRYIEDNCKQLANPDQADSDGDRTGDACDSDIDGDARSNGRDNCPYVPNADQADADRDGIGDVCDPRYDAQDADGDGVVDTADNCVDVPNEDQADSGGGPLGDACEDRDGDGVGDLVDNCVDDANADQADLDGDRRGDPCDADDDGDGVADTADNCAQAPNAAQRDSDADGRGDACDGTFDSTDGFAGGGGRLAGGVHLSVAVHSRGGSVHGSGRLVDGATDVRLLDVTGVHSDGDRAVAVGNARIGDQVVPFRLEIADGADTFELEVGDRRWAGPLVNGNLVVH